MTDGTTWRGGDFISLEPREGGVLLCAGCLLAGRCRLGLVVEALDEHGCVETVLSCAPENQGASGVAHGGWTASVMDELVGHVSALKGVYAVTGTLTVRYHKPVPISVPLRASARMTRQEGRKILVEARLFLGSSGAELATGEGIMIERDVDAHFADYQRWLDAQA
jgi:uncharacterized protein (TIGR00369 family)